ncbi:hypothetical protein LOTGIDRAFT_230223 [Lottia gigantea]|uniref:Secreted protein n=1 Tax=Lottia gigantea TaxID=225164 RepID=V4B0Z2_LOTGI|nr:hypothetical protein LOTGIDRAFT_230223 [Lottia gigantea]ESP03923.1 hypothetical protein LOTGIDRAFT_230223 [Lottia gigantea]
MRCLLLLVAVFVLSSADNQAMKERLLRVLSTLEKRAETINNQAASSPPVVDEQIESVSAQEFRESVEKWGDESKKFTDKVNALTPMILNTLTRTQDWESVAVKFEEILSGGEDLYNTVLDDILQLAERFFNSKVNPGFKSSSRCSSVQRLSRNYDPLKDSLSEVKVIDAMVSDLDCFTGEFKDISRSFDNICMDDDKLSVDRALGMLGQTIKYLYRFQLDGQQFGVAAKQMGERVAEMYKAKSGQ